MAPPEGGPILLFDGVCCLCDALVRFMIARDRGAFRFASLQSEAGRRLLREAGLDPDELSTVVLLENGRAYARSDAALRSLLRLKAPWPALYALILVPRPLRDWAYDRVAGARYRWFGRKPECSLPAPESRGRFLD